MSSFKPLRVWPGAVFGALAGLLFFVLPAVSSGVGMIGAIGGLACALAVFVWWLFFSRAAWAERLGVVALMVVAVAVTYRLVDASIAGGAMGYMLTFFSLPALAAGLGVAVFLSRHATAATLNGGVRWLRAGNERVPGYVNRQALTDEIIWLLWFEESRNPPART